MARLDKVKNLTGLVSWFANNKKLQGLVNLVLVGGIVDPKQSSDREEKQQCEEVSKPTDWNATKPNKQILSYKESPFRESLYTFL